MKPLVTIDRQNKAWTPGEIELVKRTPSNILLAKYLGRTVSSVRAMRGHLISEKTENVVASKGYEYKKAYNKFGTILKSNAIQLQVSGNLFGLYSFDKKPEKNITANLNSPKWTESEKASLRNKLRDLPTKAAAFESHAKEYGRSMSAIEQHFHKYISNAVKQKENKNTSVATTPKAVDVKSSTVNINGKDVDLMAGDEIKVVDGKLVLIRAL